MDMMKQMQMTNHYPSLYKYIMSLRYALLGTLFAGICTGLSMLCIFEMIDIYYKFNTPIVVNMERAPIGNVSYRDQFSCDPWVISKDEEEYVIRYHNEPWWKQHNRLRPVELRYYTYPDCIET
jgi:hypothetical protein